MSTDLEQADAPAAGIRQLGDFVLLEEIGRGGMGMVYRARQVSFDREVALKVLPSFAGIDPEAVARFQREAEAAGRLSHPGIVPVYVVGEIDGTWFYAMELVKGPSLFHLLDLLMDRAPRSIEGTLMAASGMLETYPELRETPIPEPLAEAAYPASCAALIMEVAGALTVAHLGKIIHRDLKPSNILVRPTGRPVLVDFGLARDELAYSVTQTGDAVGTPAYMAPEQAAGASSVDARVDVYGLGATLYEMLTMRPPFEGSHSGEIMQAILDEDPIPPRKLNPRVPRDLDTIVLTCLAKQPEERYRSAAELQSDLRAFLAGGRIRARRPGVIRVFARRVRRNRRSAYAAAAAVMAALFVGLMVGLVILNNSRQAGRLALDDARLLLIEGKARESHAAFVQATVLLGDEKMVARRRLDTFKDVFEVMYAKGHLQALDEFLDTLPAGEQRRPEYLAFRRRLAGVGKLEIAAGDRTVRITASVRAVAADGLEPAWREFPADGMLAIGQYLLRLEAAGMAPEIRAVEIQRDAVMTLEPRFRPADRVPEGMCLVSPPGRGEPFAVQRTEMPVEAYARLLASIPDEVLAAELVPLGWRRDAQPDLPVRGLSHRQARVAAALLGSHLLAPDEYRTAATGGLRDVPYPWGRRFDVERVVGDPRYAAEPLPVASRPAGASPYGILHLVGNVAEPLAAFGDGRLFSAGGHFMSEVRDLTVDARQPRVTIDVRSLQVGLRLARFMPGPDDPVAAAAVRDRLRLLRSADKPFITNHWAVQADGRVRLRQELTATSGQALVFPELDGFAALGAPLVRDRAGTELRCEPVHSGFRVVAGEDDRPRLSVERDLEALAGLAGDGDGYRLHIPLTSRVRRAVDRVELPVGCHVDEVWPPADVSFTTGGAPMLVWHRGLEAEDRSPPQGERMAFVRFRRDGALTTRWPAVGPVHRFVSRFFAALGQRDAKELQPTLAPDCRFLPQGWDREAALRNLQTLDSFTRVTVQDVSAVGDVVTVELRCSWQPAGVLRFADGADDWAVRLLLRRRGETFEVVRFAPATRADLGTLAAGVYRHEDLRATLRVPAGTSAERTSDGLVELQLELRPAGQAGVWLSLLGCLGSATEDPRAVRMRLIASHEAGGRGERTSESQTVQLGAAGGRPLRGARENWSFRTRDGKGWRSERWTFVRLGNRHLLLKAVATGADRSEAGRTFHAAEPWYRAVTEALTVE